jgi:LysR family positive regulator for ilvC
MDIRYLKLFRHLAGTLHFARTSKACYITPSALTRIIQRIEAELGSKLFIRNNRSVELTPAGTAFKKYADDVILRWNRLHDELSSDSILQGELSLYCSVTAAYGILPAIMKKYRKAHPEVRIHLETGDAAKALTRLTNQDSDAVIAALPDILPSKLACLPLSCTPLIFIGPLDHDRVMVHKNNNIDWERTPLIIPDHGLSRERIDQWFARENFVPKIYSQVAGNEAIIVMVALGCGIGLVPKLVLEKSQLVNQVQIIKNAPELKPFTIGLCTRQQNLDNPRVRALWDIAEKH